jgi:hypothetical protein
MDFLGIPFLFVTAGFIIATAVAFVQSLLLGEFEQGLGSAVSLAAIGVLAFGSLFALTTFIGIEATPGLAIAIGFAAMAWTLAFQFAYQYPFFHAALSALAIASITTFIAFGIPRLVAYLATIA